MKNETGITALKKILLFANSKIFVIYKLRMKYKHEFAVSKATVQTNA